MLLHQVLEHSGQALEGRFDVLRYAHQLRSRTFDCGRHGGSPSAGEGASNVPLKNAAAVERAHEKRGGQREASRHEPRRTVSQSRPDTDSSQSARESVSSSQSKRCLITNLPRAINPFELLMVYCAPRQWSRSDGTPLSQREIGESSANGNARSVCRTDSVIARAYAARPDASNGRR